MRGDEALRRWLDGEPIASLDENALRREVQGMARLLGGVFTTIPQAVIRWEREAFGVYDDARPMDERMRWYALGTAKALRSCARTVANLQQWLQLQGRS